MSETAKDWIRREFENSVAGQDRSKWDECAGCEGFSEVNRDGQCPGCAENKRRRSSI